MARRPSFAALLAAAICAVAAVPAAASTTGGAAVPSNVTNADGESVEPTGGAAAGDPLAVRAKLAREREARERAERERARRRAARKRREREAAERREREAERRRREAARRSENKYVFPIRGWHSYGGSGSRFGAPRSGHTHQGQDLSARAGTPVVAPHAGRVRVVDYQASGAGYYVVIDDAGSQREFVFMHLQRGSIPVREGQSVRTGQRIGRVGNTGASFGAHLHFEMWRGSWYGGGHPVDPYRVLRSWDR
jgi:murein DD-endopeptidase MepM/ murein hydrolase activator NlpD